MKPLKLTLQGFNSYETKQEVDFENLMEYGMFGIFGKTGSGKSSIIDGIIVALYGNVQNKKSRVGFINSNCDEAIITFDFAVYKNGKEQTYQVYRLFKKNNDEGITAKTAVLRMVNNGVLEPIVEKTEAVNKEIINIIGLGYDDFTRTVVLPQGAFAEFLHISGKDKGFMLERVFGLENYGDKLVKEARKLSKDATEENKRIETKLESYSSMNIDENAEIKLVEVNEQYDKYSKEKKELKEKYDEIKKVYYEVQKYNVNVQKLNELEKNQDSIEEKKLIIEKYEKQLRIVPIVEYIEKTEKQLKEQLEKLSQYEKQYQTENENCAVYKEQYTQQKAKYEENTVILAEKQETLNSIGEDVKKIDSIKIEIKRLEEQLKKLKASEIEESSKLNELTEKIDNIQTNINESKEQNINIKVKYNEETEQLIEKNKEIQKQLNERKQEVQNKKNEINIKENDVKQKQLEIQKYEVEKEKLIKLIEIKNKQIIDIKPMFIDCFVEVSQNVIELKISDVNTEYFNDKIQTIINTNKVIEEKEALLKHIENMNIASVLAKTLEEDKPCPVCGSKIHPNVAYDIQEELRRDVEKEINEQKSIVDNTKKEMTIEIEKIKTNNREYEENKNVLLGEIEKIKNEQADINGKISEISGSDGQLRKNIEESKSQLVDIEKRIDELSSGIDIDIDYIKEYDEMKKSLEKFKENERLLQKYSEEKEKYLKEIDNIKIIVSNVLLKAAEFNAEKTVHENQEKELNKKIQQKLKGKTVEEVQNVINRRKEIENINLEEKEKQYTNSQEKINKLNIDIQEIKISNDNRVENIKAKKSEINEIIDEKEVNSILKINVSSDEYRDYKEEVKSYGQSVYEIKNCIENYVYKGKDYDEEKLGIQCNEILSNREKIDKLVEEVVAEKGRLEENVKIVNKNKKEIETLKAEQEECLRKLKNYEKLESTLSGGRKKISFLDYISRRHLQFITAEASERLRRITNNRYSIEIRDDNIDFVIVDYNKGGSRRVPKTLSGGETFLVSLCLALALSKQVQLKKSSVLEFFFLDEGFGTLDSELLTVVVSTLGSLKDENLNIGIISHVEELKESMPRKLVVSETVDGSKLEVM